MKLIEVQERSFKLLCLIDDICRKEKVRYFLHAGTELGAVRDKDIIPWDDDIDIKVKLEDYPAFKCAMEKNLPDFIQLVEPVDFRPAFYDFMVRVIDTRFFLRKETDEDRFYGNKQNHVGVDVFIQHHIPEKKVQKMVAYSRLMLWYGLGMGHRYKLDYSKYSWPSKIVVFVLSLIGKHISVDRIWKWYYKDINRLNNTPSTVAMRNSMTWDGMVSTEWTNCTVQGEIRGKHFPIPAGYDAELTAYYGDYKKPTKDRALFNQHLDEEDRYKD